MVKAEIKLHHGAPSIFINDRFTEPTMFFGNLDSQLILPGVHEIRPLTMEDLAVPNVKMETYFREIERAAGAGVHIHTLFLCMDTDLSMPDAESNSCNRFILHRILEIDPEGYLIPRCHVPTNHLRTSTPESENEKFSDGKPHPESYVRADFVSDIWQEQMMRLLERFIRSILADEVLCDRVIGYHFSGGETGEWFQRRFWDAVLNVSDANARGFRRWLKAKYDTDAALSAVWNQDITINDVVVPADLPTYQRVPHTVGLLEGPGAQRFIDYMDYFSDAVASLNEKAAAVVKQETNRNSLYITFYGYHFEIPSAHSGHFSLNRLLKNPDVDAISSPVSYINRNETGVGAFMSAAASVQAAGKLWLDESDYRMPIARDFNSVAPVIEDDAAAHEVVLREYGKLALCGAGTWWMDLFDQGWFDNDAIWESISEGSKYYLQMREAAVPATAEICYLMDEKAMSLVGDTWDFAFNLLGKTRDLAYSSGLSYDLRLIEDFVNGHVDGAKLYVFMNPFRLSPERMEAIHSRLIANNAAALWMFGFGLESDREVLKQLTGFDFAITTETASSIQLGSGLTFPRVAVSPLTVPINGAVLGTYEDGRTAIARTTDAGYPSFFCGGSYVDPQWLRCIAAQTGARLYTEPGDCFNRIGSLAMLHTATAGDKTLDCAEKVTELRSGRIYEAGQCSFTAGAGETFLFILK